MQVLLGRSRQLNPRGKVFLTDAGDRLVDPWGNPFQIVLDGNGDGRVTLPPEKGGSPRTVAARVLVWSAAVLALASGAQYVGALLKRD